MRKIKISNSLNAIGLGKIIVGLGNFDGLHLGHQHVLQRVIDEAKELNATPVCLTFDPHPLQVLKAGKNPFLIMNFDQKIEVLEKMGFRNVCVIPFDENLSQWSEKKFIEKVLLEDSDLLKVVVGFNFHFGKGRQGTVAFLQKMLNEQGIEVIEVEPFKKEGKVTSSSYIREMIKKGDVEKAATFLSRPVRLSGKVVRGSSRGNMMGFPTANIDIEGDIFSPTGVYLVSTLYKNKVCYGVMNMGRRPTFDASQVDICEVHLFDIKDTLYDVHLDVDVLKKLRDEKKFSSKDDLIEQIKEDCQKARKLIPR
ncbi:riboflavin biosynthesis protein RibF [PVC group bacterium (ex Bugula neritina AB1)]|nr:riboflavin biosynthesis protein RibF [PVC group bacterium (ex Bugula neritina AB1)]